MNLVLLLQGDFVSERRARLAGRRFKHMMEVHRAAVGDALTVGLLDGPIGRATVRSVSDSDVELDVALDGEPPPALPLTLVLALPRPKVLNRVIAAAVSMGIKRIHLINAWRVEKSYWKSPRLSDDNLRAQSILGLEQGRDTMMPAIVLHRLFRPFVENELVPDPLALVAHPPALEPCPRDVRERVTLAIGPEGGFIPEEIASFERRGFRAVNLGTRILRVETALAALVGRLF